MPVLQIDHAITTEFFTPTIPGMFPDSYGPWERGLVELRTDKLCEWSFMFCVKHPTATEALDIIKQFRDGNVSLNGSDKYYLGIENPNDGSSGTPAFDATEVVSITVKLAPITLSAVEAEDAPAHAAVKKISEKTRSANMRELEDFLKKSFEFSPGDSSDLFPYQTYHLKKYGFSYLKPSCPDDILNNFRQAAQEAGTEKTLPITDARVTEMIRASNYSRTNFVGLVEDFKPEDAAVWVRMQNSETTPLWCSAAYTINRPRDHSEDKAIMKGKIENKLHEIKQQADACDIPGVAGIECLSSAIEKFSQHELLKLQS